MAQVTVTAGGTSVIRNYNNIGDVRADNVTETYLGLSYRDSRLSLNNETADANDSTSLRDGDVIRVEPKSHTKG